MSRLIKRYNTEEEWIREANRRRIRNEKNTPVKRTFETKTILRKKTANLTTNDKT